MWSGPWPELKPKVKPITPTIGDIITWNSFCTTPHIQKWYQQLRSISRNSHINSEYWQENRLIIPVQDATSNMIHPHWPTEYCLIIEYWTRIIYPLCPHASHLSTMNIRSQMGVTYTVGHPNMNHSSAKIFMHQHLQLLCSSGRQQTIQLTVLHQLSGTNKQPQLCGQLGQRERMG